MASKYRLQNEFHWLGMVVTAPFFIAGSMVAFFAVLVLCVAYSGAIIMGIIIHLLIMLCKHIKRKIKEVGNEDSH